MDKFHILLYTFYLVNYIKALFVLQGQVINIGAFIAIKKSSYPQGTKRPNLSGLLYDECIHTISNLLLCQVYQFLCVLFYSLKLFHWYINY